MKNKQQRVQENKENEIDIFTAHLEICMVLKVLFSGSAPQGKEGKSEGVNTGFIMWQLVYIWGFVLLRLGPR